MTNKIREGGTDAPATTDSASQDVSGAAEYNLAADEEFFETTVGQMLDSELAAILDQIVGQK